MIKVVLNNMEKMISAYLMWAYANPSPVITVKDCGNEFHATVENFWLAEGQEEKRIDKTDVMIFLFHEIELLKQKVCRVEDRHE